jgi:hypothetical protein
MKKYFQGKKLQTASSSLPSYSTTPSPALSLLSSPSTADLFSSGRRRRENGKSQKIWNCRHNGVWEYYDRKARQSDFKLNEIQAGFGEDFFRSR